MNPHGSPYNSFWARLLDSMIAGCNADHALETHQSYTLGILGGSLSKEPGGAL